MKLEKKKALAAKTFGVGKDRIVFNKEMLAEIKEAISNQDMRDLASQGAIFIKEIKGRKKKEKRKTRRRQGSIKKSMKRTKTHYVILTRKLRKYLAELRRKELISEENYQTLRKEIRASIFKSKSHLKERIAAFKK